MAKQFHPISELEANMDPEVLKLARKLAEREMVKIKLKELTPCVRGCEPATATISQRGKDAAPPPVAEFA
ncbi:MAG: hypothetical protein Ta2A_01180 [Treponemataceae bacterium]|nr:MAG: hypothetical protein Ta2A_01180 [Treponemataceae bacterium]